MISCGFSRELSVGTISECSDFLESSRLPGNSWCIHAMPAECVCIRKTSHYYNLGVFTYYSKMVTPVASLYSHHLKSLN